MKNNVLVAVLITSMVVSTVAAQDTIRVQSLRSVDLCSDKKRWLLAVSLGTISFSDSLESFDITIGFDKNVLRPTDVLKEGTLSGQMSNGPTMNNVVPGEMRIFGFNVARSVSGSLPLVAVSGDFVGSCTDIGVLTLPYAPDFNSEFKRRYSLSRIDEIQPLINRRVVATLGCTIESSVDTFRVGETSRTYLTSIGRTGNSDDLKGIIEFRIESDSGMLEYDQSSCKNCLVDSVKLGTFNSTMVYYTVVDSSRSKDPVEFSTTLKRRTFDALAEARIIASVRNSDTCTCTVPGRLDTVRILLEKSVVGVESSQDDGICTIEVRDDLIIGKCLHHGMKELGLFDLFGNTVLTNSKHGNEPVEMSTLDLSHGLYIIAMKCDGGLKRKTIVK